MFKRRTSYLILAFSFCVFCFSCWAGSASALKPDNGTSESLITITSAQAHVFSTALRALADNGHVVLMAEGKPVHPNLTTSVVDLLPDVCKVAVRTLPVAPKPVSQLVEAVAACYDYDVQKIGTVFVLTKRYNVANDVPSVTLGECQSSLEDVRRLTDQYNPDVPQEQMGERQPLVGEIIASLTSNQLQAMQNKTLLVNTLSPRQQALVSRMAAYFYVQLPTETLSDASAQLKEATKVHSQLTFCLGSRSGTTFFGYTSPRLTTDGFEFHVIHVLEQGSTIAKPHSGAEGPDTLPTAMTIGSAVARLNLADKAQPPLSVDAILSDKTITVAGLDGADPRDVMRGLAAMYGLRVATHDNGDLVLTRPEFLAPRDITELSESIRQALPAPFLRLMHTDEMDADAQRQEDEVKRLYAEAAQQQSVTGVIDSASSKIEQQPAAKSVLMLPTRESADAHRASLKRQRELRHQVIVAIPDLEATTALRLQGDLLADGNISAHWAIPIAKLTDDERQAFAAHLMAQFLIRLASSPLLRRQVPPYITNPDQLYLTGSFDRNHPGSGHAGVFLSTATPDGRVFPTVGIGVPLAVFPN